MTVAMTSSGKAKNAAAVHLGHPRFLTVGLPHSGRLYESGVLQNLLEMEYNLRGWQVTETLHKGAES